ncbi:glycosyltransferase [Sulfurovum sp. bin170]|uniref:glycosyltransferase n=1 Tax=Sulfurovum sp. bin170 TaxID=2695268 RepID=UPI0013E08760|nr:glycosyltransferase [Sulfurovum sp. bin170]NEW60756.1 glycosyltransferase [Sulfurovum sp. bin170]
MFKNENREKIIFIIHEMSMGGATRVILNLVNNLEEDKFETHLVVFNNRGSLLPKVKKSVTIHNLNSSRVLLGTHKLLYLLLKERPSVVFTGITHVNLTIAMWIPMLKLRLKNTKFITREVNIPSVRAKYLKKSKKMDYIYRRVITRFDRVVAQSQYMKSDIISTYGVDAEKITVVNNPLDAQSINEQLKQRGDKRLLPPDKINIVATGMLRQQKAFEKLLDVFALLDDRYHLHIIGEGPEREMLERRIDELGIEKKVTLQGLQKNPYPYIKEADLVVLSSRYEGFPNVLLEANTCGKFVVANACPGVNEEIIIDKVNGVLVEDNNSEAFARAIEQYANMRHDEEKIIETIGRYNVKSIVEIYKNIFTKDISQNLLESETLVPNITRLKPSVPSFTRSLKREE